MRKHILVRLATLLSLENNLVKLGMDIKYLLLFRGICQKIKKPTRPVIRMTDNSEESSRISYEPQVLVFSDK